MVLSGYKEVFISIGSNTLDRHSRITEALAALRGETECFRQSEIYSTPCWRGEGEDYMNVVAVFRTCLTPEQLDAKFKQMETDAGRSREVADKNIVPLDVDLVVYDGEILRERDFSRNYFTIGYGQLTDPRNIQIQNYFYELPDERIALHPLRERDKCKLLVCAPCEGLTDTVFDKIGDFLPADSLLVYNNTRVINARIRFVKDSGAMIEIFCLEPVSPADYQLNFSSTEPVRWKCLVGNSKRWKSGALTMSLRIDGHTVVLTATRIEKTDSESIVEFSWNDSSLSFSEIIGVAGEIPIPPYLNRKSEESDKDDYQTVYSKIEGSVAAPTAGLHFTDELLEKLERNGIKRRSVTLHVGAGTFQPVKADSIGGHSMHSELIDVSRRFIEELQSNKRPLTAVGTTTVRTLESLYHIGCSMLTGKWHGELEQWSPYTADNSAEISKEDALGAILDYLDKNGEDRLVTSTRIIIAPSYRYRIVDNIVTNFHQPGSTLLLLIAAVVGDSWRDIYDHALANGYRFLSYGDACLFLSVRK